MKNQKGFGVIIIVAIFAIVLLAGFLSVSLSRAKHNTSKMPIIPPAASPSSKPSTPQAQGVKSTITHRTGDCMPTTVGSHNSCNVHVFTDPLTVIIKQNQNVVKQIPEVKGQFGLELPAGAYNMYVVYRGRETCNSVDLKVKNVGLRSNQTKSPITLFKSMTQQISWPKS